MCPFFFLIFFQIAALAYAVAFQHPSFWGYLWAVLYSVIFDWFLVGIAVASTCRLLNGMSFVYLLSHNPCILILIPRKSSINSIATHLFKFSTIFLTILCLIFSQPMPPSVCILFWFSYMSTNIFSHIYIAYFFNISSHLANKHLRQHHSPHSVEQEVRYY